MRKEIEDGGRVEGSQGKEGGSDTWGEDDMEMEKKNQLGRKKYGVTEREGGERKGRLMGEHS